MPFPVPLPLRRQLDSNVSALFGDPEIKPVLLLTEGRAEPRGAITCGAMGRENRNRKRIAYASAGSACARNRWSSVRLHMAIRLPHVVNESILGKLPRHHTAGLALEIPVRRVIVTRAFFTAATHSESSSDIQRST